MIKERRNNCRSHNEKEIGLKEKVVVSKFSDVPVENLEEDMLGFGDYARGIINTIEGVSEKDTPLTIAIFGQWGSGKTSLMKIMQDILISKGYEKIVFFNSWEYGAEEKPWIPFMVTVVDTLFEKEIDKRKLIQSIFLFSSDVVLQTYSQGLISIGGILDRESTRSILGKMVPEIVQDIFKKSRKTTRFKEWSDGDTNTVIERIIKIKEFKKEIEKKAEKVPNKKIIIFIDDLDRISEKLVDFLNSLKIFFDIRGCIFILGCDFEILDSELKKKYSSDVYEDYFDKIVQAEFYIPGISEQAINSYLRILTGWNEQEIEKCKQLVIHSIGGNPRKIKRAVNATALIKNVFESKLATILKEFERPKLKGNRDHEGKEMFEKPEAFSGEIAKIFTPSRMFKILFDETALFKLVCMREQWYDIYESILGDEEKQRVFISLQKPGSEKEISELIVIKEDKEKQNEEEIKKIEKNLPIFLKDPPQFQEEEDLKTYLNLLATSSPEAGLFLEYPEPEKQPDKIFNRYMLFERINKGIVEEKIIEKKIDQMHWESDLDSIYFFIEAIRAFGYDHLIKRLIEKVETSGKIIEKIRESKDPEGIGSLLNNVYWIDKEIASGLLTETKGTYAEKIRESKDPRAIGSLLHSMYWIDKEIAIGLLTETKDTMAEKIRESKDPGAVGLLLDRVSWIDSGIAKRLLTETKGTYAEKIRESKDPASVGWLLYDVNGIDNGIAIGLLSETKGTYAKKIRESIDPGAVASLLGIVERIDSEIAKELLAETKDTYAKKIGESKDPGALASLLGIVNGIDSGNAKGLLTETKGTYAEKIRESKDPRAVGSLLDGVNKIDSGNAKGLLAETRDTYAEKIKESKDPGAVGWLLAIVNSIDSGIARGLLAETKDTYAEKIRKSKSPLEVKPLLDGVNDIDSEIARELLLDAMSTYTEKIKESKDLRAVESLLRIWGEMDSNIARELLAETKGTYAEKIKESKDPGAVGSLLDIVNIYDKEIARELLAETRDTYAEKIKESKDPGAMESLLGIVRRIDDETAMSISPEQPLRRLIKKRTQQNNP